MALSEHYELRYLDPDASLSDFPSQWDHVIDKIDTGIHDAATAPVSLSRVPSLPAGKVTSGKFADARIPDSIVRTSKTTALENRIKELEDVIRGTGARSIINVIPDDTYNSGSFVVERTGNMVTLIAKSLLLNGDGYTYIGRLPVGFRPAASLTTIASTRTGGSGSPAQPMPLNLDANGGMGMAVDGNHAHISEAFVTSDSWPSSLPGDPA